MRILEDVGAVWQDTRPTVLIRHPEWIMDAILGGAVRPTDTVVITGFWRSGTTWLLETLSRALRAKSAFEPLRPQITGYEAYASALYSGEERTINGFMPFGEGQIAAAPTLHRHLHRALVGATPGAFVRAARFRVREHEDRVGASRFAQVRSRLQDSMRLQVVTKFTRAHLVLPQIRAEWAPTVLHIRRDPRAVVESLLRQEWSEWARSMSLADYLLTPEDGRSEIFSRWKDLIHQCDERSYISRIAGYWALTEWYVDQFASDGVIPLEFEQLCRDGIDYLRGTVEESSEIEVSKEDMQGVSNTSKAKKSTEERVYGWKDNLGLSDINQIEEVVCRCGMGDKM